jgi:hypothetical protein
VALKRFTPEPVSNALRGACFAVPQRLRPTRP